MNRYVSKNLAELFISETRVKLIAYAFLKPADPFHLRKIARENNLRYVLDGSNLDDARDFRPGSRAARELGVRSVLFEAKLNKEDIRLLSRRLGLSTWDKPSLACLASRFPYGMRITRQDLKRVNNAEIFLRGLGITQVRVRNYSQIARIEVLREQIPKLLGEEARKKIVAKFNELGYLYITVDLEGYRSGSLNPR